MCVSTMCGGTCWITGTWDLGIGCCLPNLQNDAKYRKIDISRSSKVIDLGANRDPVNTADIVC